MSEPSVVVRTDGTLAFLWADDLQPLTECGEVSIRRASHVEPESDGRWSADLSPVDGPKLGPFNLRGEALAAEVAWLEEHYLC